ncbi:uncharacterized protein [Pseudochaenichthys georgianus]|uniref:uncharacterized protein isoform X2 n=1 Tax=Pseudochaenichthys georgianus TaxID=52239 RepID=UPI00146C9511|nr:uncharacterized protein LOC117445276 isoform X2 [Pseudochaenichthys georgianus]
MICPPTAGTSSASSVQPTVPKGNGWPGTAATTTDMLPWIMWSWTSRRCWSSERRRPSLTGATTTMWSQRRRLPARGAGPQTTFHCQRRASQMTVRSGTGDEEEPTSPPPDTADSLTPMGHNRTLSMPDMGNRDLSINHQHSQSDISAEGTHDKARHEALQKLATFFHAPKPAEPAPSIESVSSPVLVEEEEDSLPEVTTLDFDHPDMIILPPPDMYADLTVE